MNVISRFCIDCKCYSNDFRTEPCYSCEEREPTKFKSKYGRMLEHWTEIICDKSTCANSKDGRCTLTNVKLEGLRTDDEFCDGFKLKQKG
jgi:hypothetical protein